MFCFILEKKPTNSCSLGLNKRTIMMIVCLLLMLLFDWIRTKTNRKMDFSLINHFYFIRTLSVVESGSTLKNPIRSNWNLSNGLLVLMPSSTRALELIVKES